MGTEASRGQQTDAGNSKMVRGAGNARGGREAVVTRDAAPQTPVRFVPPMMPPSVTRPGLRRAARALVASATLVLAAYGGLTLTSGGRAPEVAVGPQASVIEALSSATTSGATGLAEAGR